MMNLEYNMILYLSSLSIPTNTGIGESSIYNMSVDMVEMKG